ncbi:MAG: hypothetical protein ACM3X9_00775 [Bacillota bacterium]
MKETEIEAKSGFGIGGKVFPEKYDNTSGVSKSRYLAFSLVANMK